MILRVGLCIPTYNNPLSIEAVVLDCLRETSYPILIVDDGSSPPVADLLRAPDIIAALRSERVRVLRFNENRGKGAALQAAFRKGVGLGWTHLIALDGDGQHHAREAAGFVREAQKHPWDLIIGKRKMDAGDVPGVSRFGRDFSNFWVDYQTGQPISDSQSGYRLYPLFHLQTMTFWTRRYDFEIEVLIKLIWKGVGVREVEIDVFYPKKEERVSHFDKFWDNVRISCLNTLFVVISLLKTHRSPAEAAWAMGTGTLIGSTPFFGLHTLMVAVASFGLRLNALFLWIGSQISIPPLAPFVIAASIWVGSHLVGTPTYQLLDGADIWSSSWHFRAMIEFAASHFFQWLIGSLIVGSFLGLITGLLTYVVARRIQAPAQNWSGRTRGGRFGNGFLKVVIQTFGVRAGYFFLYFIIPYFYFFAPKGRRSLNEYWRITRPDLTWRARQLRVMKHFFRFGQILMDRVAQSFTPEPLFQTDRTGFDNILNPLREGHGLIMLGAHVGGWDLSASLAKRDGLTQKLNIIEFRSSELSFQDVKAKKDVGHLTTLTTNVDQQPIFNIHNMLADGRPVGLMGDRPMSPRLELVTFFGQLAPFDVTAFRLAAATRQPLLMTFGFRHSKSPEYHFYAFPSQIYSYEPGDRAQQCHRWLQVYVMRLEDMLRRYPDQWFNFYPFLVDGPNADGVATSSPNAARLSARIT